MIGLVEIMIVLILKGIIIGFFMLFPGLSGGSIAIILEEYDNIIFHTSSVIKTPKKSLVYLFFISLGGMIGLLFSSKIIGYFKTNFYNEVLYFFLGIMVVFIIDFIYKNTKNKIKANNILYIFLGVITSLLISIIPVNFFALDSLFSLFIFGVLVAVALILPGISVSYILLVFSCYDSIILAISNLDLFFLFKIGIFILIGIALTIKLIEKSMVKYSKETNLIISGFMIGSFLMIIKFPKDVFELNIMVIFLLIGILFFLIFGKIIKK